MSTNITIRDIPEEVYEKLKRQAKLNHRSVNSEIIFHLKKMVQSHRRDPSQMITQAKKIKKKTKGTLSIEEIQKFIDRGRP